MGELYEDLLDGDEDGHRLLGQAVACHQILVVAQWLLPREALDSGKVRPH
jgi:hypothetical protein